MVRIDAIAALHISHAGAWLCENGEVRPVDRQEAKARALSSPLLIANTPMVGARLGYAELSGFDLLELFAFVFPARFVIPSPAALPPPSTSPSLPAIPRPPQPCP
jgi:ATP-dependent DNA helicase DinG